MRTIAVDKEGLINFKDFKAALRDPTASEEEQEVCASLCWPTLKRTRAMCAYVAHFVHVSCAEVAFDVCMAQVWMLAAEGEGRFDPVPPKPIPELYDAHLRGKEAADVSEDTLGHFKVKLKPLTAFTQVWVRYSRIGFYMRTCVRQVFMQKHTQYIMTTTIT
jgi:hypothetical protein